MAVTSMLNSSLKTFRRFDNMSTTFGVSPYPCDYVVIAGGGGGGNNRAGGGGAGGYRAC